MGDSGSGWQWVWEDGERVSVCLHGFKFTRLERFASGACRWLVAGHAGPMGHLTFVEATPEEVERFLAEIEERHEPKEGEPWAGAQASPICERCHAAGHTKDDTETCAQVARDSRHPGEPGKGA